MDRINFGGVSCQGLANYAENCWSPHGIIGEENLCPLASLRSDSRAISHYVWVLWVLSGPGFSGERRQIDFEKQIICRSQTMSTDFTPEKVVNSWENLYRNWFALGPDYFPWLAQQERMPYKACTEKNLSSGGWNMTRWSFKCCLFSPLLGEMITFD